VLLWPDRFPAEHLTRGAIADRIIVDKSDRRLELWRGKDLIGAYPVSLGRVPEGPKRQRGDARTPEGDYVIDARNPHSAFHLSLHVSYPNETDLATSQARGADPGGEIFIHATPNWWPLTWLPPVDWTAGCIAVSDRDIEEIWAAVPDGTRIRIRP
jgi:murein L,D-transpeptidase YafK